MDNGIFSRKSHFLLFLFQLFFMHTRAIYTNKTINEGKFASPVGLLVQANQVLLYNQYVKITIAKEGGLVTSIQYNKIDNLLANADPGKHNSGYWDCDWQSDTGRAQVDKLWGTQFKVISNTPDQVEVSFLRLWDKKAPLAMNVDKRFILRRGISGFYTYAIWERLQGWPSVQINTLRIVFKLKENLFRYMALSDKRQRDMPTAADRFKGKVLPIREAVRLPNGEVDDKYQYSADFKDSHLHGWIADNPATGFWMITPTDEFRVGGPFRQDLTSHVSATTMSVFHSSHYAEGETQASGVYFAKGEPWKKVFGPVLVYLNSATSKAPRQELWQNAKNQLFHEVKSWPYSFPLSVDYLKAAQRGMVTGRLKVLDRFINKLPQTANNANVGLALPGAIGSWETEDKGYQFWTKTDNRGDFSIRNVRPGTYNLYAWVPGVIGDYKYNYPVMIRPGSVVRLNNLLFVPPRNGPTFWEIGIPDRLAAEFYVPDVNLYYVNHLYTTFDKFRQYGLWDRYTELYPQKDLTFTIGHSDYHKDWFYAHVPRMGKDGKLRPATWDIIFQLNTVRTNVNYILRVAIASATFGKLRVAVNSKPPIYSSSVIGRDNAIARHGIHGLYHLLEVKIWGSNFIKGRNVLHLTQDTTSAVFAGFMYDYIRFEGPPN